MQNEVVDKKIEIIYDNYSNHLYAKNAQRDVEGIRRKAMTLGAGISTFAFVGNELARLSLRSPIFKLKPQNVLFWALVPTFLAQRAYDKNVDARIEQLWRVHRNRVDRGLGGTWRGSGFHEGQKQDMTFRIPNAAVTLDEILDGTLSDIQVDNAFLRWHKSFADYPSHLIDIDDHILHEHDNFERLKKYTPDKKNVNGVTPVLPYEDNDEKFDFYDKQGEGLYTNPPDQNTILVDHGLDEDHIWAFSKTLYNQDKVANRWSTPDSSAGRLSYAPFWGEKLQMPAWFKREKMPKFFRHWDHRLGLEAIKIRHALSYGNNPTDQQRDSAQSEVAEYIDKCYEYEKNTKLDDVYVTDHAPVDAKYVTGGGREDQDYRDYQRSLDEYNSDSNKKTSFNYQAGKYEKGSLLQRMLDPFADSERDAQGTILLNVSQAEVDNFSCLDDEKLREQFAAAKAKEDVWDLDDEDEDAFRMALAQELTEDRAPFSVKDFDEVLTKEFGVFKEGEKYDYVKDLKNAYKDSLKTTAEQRILATIPDHVFWDIKTPQARKPAYRKGKYNPFRGREFENFFAMRDYDEYRDEQSKKRNLNASVSTTRRH